MNLDVQTPLQVWEILTILSLFFFKKLFIYLSLAVLGLSCCVGFSLVVTSGGYSLVAVCGLLIAVASLVVEHRLQAHGLQ